MRGKKRQAYAWIALILLALVFAPPAFAHHQPSFGNLRTRVGGLEFQVAALQAAGTQQATQGPPGPPGPPGQPGADGTDGTDGTGGTDGTDGQDGEDGVTGYQVFEGTLDFGPGGIGGTWCGAPAGATEDEGWRVVSGGAELSSADIDKGFVIAGSWPNLTDPNNPGWSVQLNKPSGQDPGNVTVYAVCIDEIP